MNALPVGATRLLPVAPAPGVAVRLSARRLASRFILLRADASFGSAAQTVFALVQLRGLELQPPVAARARSVDAAVSPHLRGVDGAPAGWSCPVASDTVTALLLQSGDSDSTFYRFGDRDWRSVSLWASSVPTGGDSLGVRFVAGDLSLAATRSLGVLVVDGDLTLSAGAEVVGVVIVHGSLVLRGSGGTIVGALVASQVVAAPGFAPIRPVVEYSSCAVEAARLSRAWPEPLPGQFMVTSFQGF